LILSQGNCKVKKASIKDTKTFVAMTPFEKAETNHARNASKVLPIQFQLPTPHQGI